MHKPIIPCNAGTPATHTLRTPRLIQRRKHPIQLRMHRDRLVILPSGFERVSLLRQALPLLDELLHVSHDQLLSLHLDRGTVLLLRPPPHRSRSSCHGPPQRRPPPSSPPPNPSTAATPPRQAHQASRLPPVQPPARPHPPASPHAQSRACRARWDAASRCCTGTGRIDRPGL